MDPEVTPDAPVEPPVNPAPAPSPEPIVDPPLGEAGEKAFEAMKVRAREAEKASKAAIAELDKLRKAAMSDQDKAVAEAEERGRKSANTESASRLAAAEIKAALTGVVPDPSAVVEDLNLAKYVTEDGDVNAEAIAGLRDKYAAFATPAGKPAVPGVPTGVRPDSGVKQLTKAEIKGMTPDQISAARKNGQFADLMSGKT